MGEAGRDERPWPSDGCGAIVQTMPFAHAVVWLDHHTARVIGFSRDHHEVMQLVAEHAARQTHRKRDVVGSGHAPPDRSFFASLADALEGVDEVLLTGPGVAKTEFDRYLARRRADVARHIVAIESVDHPTDGQLLAHARSVFKRIDQLGVT